MMLDGRCHFRSVIHQPDNTDIRQLFPAVPNGSLLSIIWTLKLAPENLAALLAQARHPCTCSRPGRSTSKADSPARYLDRSGIGPC